VTRLPALVLPLVLLALPACAAPPDLASAEALVRAQYAPDADASPEAAAKLYVPEIAQEMTDPIRGAGAVNLGIDPRYGQDDWKVSDVKVEAVSGPDGRALVTAKFLDFGKPAKILWTLVPAPDTPSGWRVWDISGPEQNDWAAFDMRQLLNLPTGK
jgi:hypothetical protein